MNALHAQSSINQKGLKKGLWSYSKEYFICLTLLFFSVFVFAQNRNTAPIDSLLNELNRAISDEKKVDIYIALSDAYFFNIPDSCLYYANQAFEISKNLGKSLELAKSHAALGRYYHSRQKYDISGNNFEIADSIFNLIGSPKQKSKVKYEYCVHLSQSLKIDTSILVCKAALTIAEENDFPELLAKLYSRLASIQYYKGDYEDALKGFRASIDVNEKLGNYDKVAEGYSSIGSILNRIGDKESAIKEQEKALEIYEKYDLKKGICVTCSNLAGYYRALGQFKNSKELFLRAIEVGKSINYSLCLSSAYSNISDTYIDEKKYMLAINTLNKALPLSKENNDVFMEEYIYGRLGRAYEKLNQLNKAEEYFKKSLELINKRDNVGDQAEGYQSLAGFYSRTGKYEEAYKNLITANTLNDSVYTEERLKEISKLQTEFETAEKEKEIQLLEKDNELKAVRIRQQQRNLLFGILGVIFFLGLAAFLFLQRQSLQRTKSKLEVSLSEKETLLKEIHHRVKNNLQLIMSLLNLQAEEGKEQTIEDFLYKGQNRVKSMALIHEQLYRSDNVSAINMREYLEQLVGSIFEAFDTENINYVVEADASNLDIDKAIPLGLIVNELVNNSLKHAFHTKKSGNLVVQLKQRNKAVEVMVKDDGSGFEADSSQESMGWQLIKILTQQLKGTIDLQQQAGTRVSILFPTTLAA